MFFGTKDWLDCISDSWWSECFVSLWDTETSHTAFGCQTCAEIDQLSQRLFQDKWRPSNPNHACPWYTIYINKRMTVLHFQNIWFLFPFTTRPATIRILRHRLQINGRMPSAGTVCFYWRIIRYISAALKTNWCRLTWSSSIMNTLQPRVEDPLGYQILK